MNWVVSVRGHPLPDEDRVAALIGRCLYIAEALTGGRRIREHPWRSERPGRGNPAPRQGALLARDYGEGVPRPPLCSRYQPGVSGRGRHLARSSSPARSRIRPLTPARPCGERTTIGGDRHLRTAVGDVDVLPPASREGEARPRPSRRPTPVSRGGGGGRRRIATRARSRWNHQEALASTSKNQVRPPPSDPLDRSERSAGGQGPSVEVHVVVVVPGTPVSRPVDDRIAVRTGSRLPGPHLSARGRLGRKTQRGRLRMEAPPGQARSPPERESDPDRNDAASGGSSAPSRTRADAVLAAPSCASRTGGRDWRRRCRPGRSRARRRCACPSSQRPSRASCRTQRSCGRASTRTLAPGSRLENLNVALPFLVFFFGPLVISVSGAVASRFRLTERVATPPPLVAVQVSVVPGVSALIVVGSAAGGRHRALPVAHLPGDAHVAAVEAVGAVRGRRVEDRAHVGASGVLGRSGVRERGRGLDPEDVRVLVGVPHDDGSALGIGCDVRVHVELYGFGERDQVRQRSQESLVHLRRACG